MTKADQELTAMNAAYAALSGLEQAERARALEWISRKLGLGGAVASLGVPVGQQGTALPAADATGQTAKAFVASKRPMSDIQRVAVLAYYLTHGRGTATFETKDLTKLNGEAAQRSFSNAAYAVSNALKADYLATAGGGKKQITTRGEGLVQALPDQQAAKTALEANPAGGRRRAAKKRSAKKSS